METAMDPRPCEGTTGTSDCTSTSKRPKTPGLQPRRVENTGQAQARLGGRPRLRVRARVVRPKVGEEAKMGRHKMGAAGMGEAQERQRARKRKGKRERQERRRRDRKLMDERDSLAANNATGSPQFRSRTGKYRGVEGKRFLRNLRIVPHDQNSTINSVAEAQKTILHLLTNASYL